MKLLLTFLLLPLSIIIPAQEKYVLSGKIKSSGNVIDGLQILLLDSAETNFIKSTLPEADGTFTLTDIDQGIYALLIMNNGSSWYKKTGIRINKNIYLDTIQGPEEEQLEEITVRSSKPMIEIKPDKLILNVNNSSLNAGSTALEVLSRAPGVRVDQNDVIALKGKQGVVVMIDGKIQQISSDDLANLLKNLPSQSIEKIELISNPGAQYDAAGNAGIINIITKRTGNNGYSGSANIFYGQGLYPKAGTGLNIQFKKNKWNYFLNYNFSYRLWFSHLTLDRKFMDENNNSLKYRYVQDNYSVYNFKNHSSSFGTDYRISEKSTIGISGSINTNKFEPTLHNTNQTLNQMGNMIYSFLTEGAHQNLYYNYAGTFF